MVPIKDFFFLIQFGMVFLELTTDTNLKEFERSN